MEQCPPFWPNVPLWLATSFHVITAGLSVETKMVAEWNAKVSLHFMKRSSVCVKLFMKLQNFCRSADRNSIAKWSGLAAKQWVGRFITEGIAVIYRSFVFCQACYYSKYTDNMSVALWMCVWLRMLSAPCLIPRACTIPSARDSTDIDWSIFAFPINETTLGHWASQMFYSIPT